jgi:hypothetical protein
VADEAYRSGSNGNWFQPPSWRWIDLVALAVWTSVVAWLFWDAARLHGALFYFDITEINFPYRSFFAEELRAGRFSRWCPTLYCGFPLYSESQAGYLHPFKYLLYPWMETWKAFNYDTILSIWLTGTGTYGWLRRRVRPVAALAGAAIFGLGGFTWAHLVHTSMINALASVPLVIWGLEVACDSGRWRGVVVAAAALACQVFAGHLQDVLLTSGIVGMYGLYRSLTGPAGKSRWSALAMAAAVCLLGLLLSAVQWIPSKELLDRSPRAGGLSYKELTYGSFSPELLPTLVIREAYGTRARDTDWMDGFYPYHEMNVYLGLLGLMLAVIGAGGPGLHDRWVNFWVLLVAVGGLLMLGKYSLLFDHATAIPILGSSREPVRFHLWVSLAVAALAAVGVERLCRPGAVRLRPALALAGILIVASVPILLYNYAPVWTDPGRWNQPYHLARFRWLFAELRNSAARDALILTLGVATAWICIRTERPAVRARLAWMFPGLLLADLALTAAHEAPTVPPSYWTAPPESALRLKADPEFIRVFGEGDRHSGEPGYASEPINFLRARDALDWSLPAVWGVASAKGETPMIPKRLLDYFDHAKRGAGRYDIESVSHVVTGRNLRKMFSPNEPAGEAFIHHNPKVLPRARLAGRPIYVDGPVAAVETVAAMSPETRDRLIVEDPSRPLPESAEVQGTARILLDLPEQVVVETESSTAAYLFLADTFDPGWSATVNGVPAPIRPAYAAFRAVALLPGKHTVVFTYRPAGFTFGLLFSGMGVVLACVLWLAPGIGPAELIRATPLTSAVRFRILLFGAIALIVLISAFQFEPGPRLTIHKRWSNSFHRFTWGAGIEAMKEYRG